MGESIRNVAVGLIVRSGRALVEDYAARPGRTAFARAIGGGIEFGETAAEAVRREFEEELGARLTEAMPIAVLENIFETDETCGHEVVHIFAARCPELEALPVDATLPVRDSHTSVSWHQLGELAADAPPLYPLGIMDLVIALDGAS